MRDGAVSFKDYFSAQAGAYADFRPHYPDAMFDYLVGIAPGHALAWDCATGNGQAAVGLARHVQRVVATDASAEQLAHAEPHPQVSYRRAGADASGLEAASVDLVTVAQALHWLDLPKFFAEVRRVLRPLGVFAASCYDVVRIAPDVDAIIDRYYYETLRGYWAPERQLVDEHYRSIALPFPELAPPPFRIELAWTRDHLIGYLRTWSATRAYVERTGHDPVVEVERSLATRWPRPEEERLACWPLYLRVGRNERGAERAA